MELNNSEQQQKLIEDFVAHQGLPPAYADLARRHYAPLAQWLYRQWQDNGAYVIGINGAQGTGKSTLAGLLKILLQDGYDLKIVCLSIDDFYLSRESRARLAEQVHPLLATRGVPGTHDVQLGIRTIHELGQLEDGQTVSLPQFVKALDDRAPCAQWPTISQRPNLILFEGWCVGSLPQSPDALHTPVNTLEAEQDPSGEWRQYVNQKLETDYRQWFALLDRLILLKAPNFDCVYQWRCAQERHNAQGYENPASRVMSAKEIRHFIQHYERLTHANLRALPPVAEVVINLNTEHGVDAVKYKPNAM